MLSGWREVHFGVKHQGSPFLAQFIEYVTHDGCSDGGTCGQAGRGRESSGSNDTGHGSSGSSSDRGRNSDGGSGGSSGSSGSSGDSGGTAAPGDLWLVFMDEGMSLQQLIFAAPDGGQVVPSDFWHGLRTSPAVSSVFHTLILQVSRRQLGVALSLSSVVAR
jgi:hypothetical protein